MEHKTKSPTFTGRGIYNIFKNCVRLIRRCKVNLINNLDKVFATTLSRSSKNDYLCTIFKNCVNMKPLDYTLRLRHRPSKVHPDTCRMQIIIRLQSSGKRYYLTAPFIFKTDEVVKFDTLTHPLDTSDFNYETWVKIRGWAWDVSSAMMDLIKNPDRINWQAINDRVKFYMEQRKQGKRDWTIGNVYSNINAGEGVGK